MVSLIKQVLLRESASIDDVRTSIWSAGVDESSYAAAPGGYHSAILEQYKLYVEMADRVAARRGITNTFFLTLNTGLLAAGATAAPHLHGRIGLRVLAAATLALQCVAWFWIIRS